MRDDCLLPAINSRARHFIRKRRVAEAFAAADMPEMAQHLRDCQEISRQCICTNCSETFYIPDRCRQRTCPLCSYAAARKRGAWILRMLGAMKFPKMLTLTIRRTNNDPGDVVDYLRACFNELRKDKCFDRVKGGAYQIELKWRGDGWHIHLHAMLDSPYLPRQWIYTAWCRITGQEVVNIDIKAAKTEAEQVYVAKYAAKSADYEGDIPQVVAWYMATKGKRLFTSFGDWYNKEPPAEQKEEGFKQGSFACPFCGRVGSCCSSAQVRFVVGRSSALLFEQAARSQGPPTLDLW